MVGRVLGDVLDVERRLVKRNMDFVQSVAGLWDAGFSRNSPGYSELELADLIVDYEVE